MDNWEERQYTVVLKDYPWKYPKTSWGSIMMWPTLEMADNWRRSTKNHHHFLRTVILDNGLAVRVKPKTDELDVVSVVCTWWAM